MWCERDRGVKDGSKMFDLSNRGNGITTYGNGASVWEANYNGRSVILDSRIP